MMTNPDEPAVEAAAIILSAQLCWHQPVEQRSECTGRFPNCSCRDVARAALVAAERAAWRPIVEAPRDGTPVLVAIAGDEFLPMLVQAPRAKSKWHVVGSESRALTKEPTHWRPLPAPPAGSASSPTRTRSPHDD